MAAPTTTPRWADAGGAITDPPSAKKDVGWIVAEKPAAQYLNWLFYWVTEWVQYVALGVYDYALTVTAAAAGNGITCTGHTAGAGIDATGGTTDGTGVLGTGGATNGVGVEGQGTGTGTGVKGTGGASNGLGVLGTGVATNHGVKGVPGVTATTIAGVYGETVAASQYGVKGTTANTGGTGVNGSATAADCYAGVVATTVVGALSLACSGGPMYLPVLAADPAAPAVAEGYMYWNTTAHTLKVYDGSGWKTVTVT